MPTRIEMLRSQQLQARRTAAAQVAARALGKLHEYRHLVTRCPPELVYRIEADIEDLMDGLPFDVIYLDLLPQARREEWLEHPR